MAGIGSEENHTFDRQLRRTENAFYIRLSLSRILFFFIEIYEGRNKSEKTEPLVKGTI